MALSHIWKRGFSFSAVLLKQNIKRASCVQTTPFQADFGPAKCVTADGKLGKGFFVLCDCLKTGTLSRRLALNAAVSLNADQQREERSGVPIAPRKGTSTKTMDTGKVTNFQRKHASGVNHAPTAASRARRIITSKDLPTKGKRTRATWFFCVRFVTTKGMDLI